MDAEDDDDDDDEVQYIVETNVTDVKKFTHNSWNSEETQTLHAGVFEMTYTVSSGTLNPSIPYHTIPTTDPLPGGADSQNLYQLEMVTTFTNKPNLVRIDA